MTPGITSTQQAGFAALLHCARCTRRLREHTAAGQQRGYQCTPVCRSTPIPADWLDDQVKKALAGKVSMARATDAVTAITVGDTEPAGVRVRWRNNHRITRQPDTTRRPATVFVPAGTRRT